MTHRTETLDQFRARIAERRSQCPLGRRAANQDRRRVQSRAILCITGGTPVTRLTLRLG